MAGLCGLLLFACDNEGNTDGEDTLAADTSVADGGQDARQADVGTDTGPTCPAPTGARPRARSEHEGVFDPVDDRLVMFGGSFGFALQCDFPTPTFEAETWAYDTACDQWSQIEGTQPEGRTRHMMAYDSTGHRAVLFGGRSRVGTSGNYTVYNDVWALDLETDTWSEITTTGTAPTPRVNGAFVYDSKRNRFLLFGGNTSPSGFSYAPQNDLWHLGADGSWAPINLPDPPEPRLFMGALYDPKRDWLVIYGGSDNSAFSGTVEYFDDVWALDLGSTDPGWVRLDTEGASDTPPGRFWASLEYDATNDRYLMFGGHDNASFQGDLGARNDLQAFDPESRTWSVVGIGDTYANPITDACDPPADYTNVDMDFPERRYSTVFAGDGESLWMAGGKTDCGIVDDLFRLDFADDTWTELTPANVGEVCIRQGGTNCNGLCF